MIIYGTGGHSKVLFSILEKDVSHFFDDKSNDVDFYGIKISRYDPQLFSKDKLLIGVGNNKLRLGLSGTIKHEFGTVVEKSSVIHKDIMIGKGTQLLHNSVVQIESQIGSHVIINTNANIDHDCEIGDFVHVAPGCTLCGNVSIGKGTLIGAGSVVLPGVTIGDWCTIGAGSLVNNDVPSNCLGYGNPFRIIQKT